jgi:hypothetical protein
VYVFNFLGALRNTPSSSEELLSFSRTAHHPRCREGQSLHHHVPHYAPVHPPTQATVVHSAASRRSESRMHHVESIEDSSTSSSWLASASHDFVFATITNMVCILVEHVEHPKSWRYLHRACWEHFRISFVLQGPTRAVLSFSNSRSKI